MIKRDFITLAIAAACGAVAFLLVLNYMKAPQETGTSFVIAVKDVPPGHTLAPGDVALSGRVKTDPQGLFMQPEDVLGKQVVSAISKGTLVYRSQLKMAALPAAKTPLREIPEGMRALTLAAKEIDNIPALLTDQSFVDVIGKVPDHRGRLEFQTVVRGAKVHSLEHEKEKGLIRSVTLVLRPVAAEVITKSTARGKLRLILRPGGGNEEVYKTGEVLFTEVIRGTDKERKVRSGRAGNPKEIGDVNY